MATWLETLEDWSEYASEQLWGPTPRTVIQRSQMQIRQSIRKLEREKQKLQADEKKYILNIKSSASNAKKASDLKIQALTIARCRRGMSRIDNLIFSLNGMNQDLLESGTQSEMNSVMQNVTHALINVNSTSSGVQGIYSVVKQYERQKQVFEMAKEVISDTYDAEVEEEDADILLEQLNDELHLNLDSLLPQPGRTHAFTSQDALDLPSVPPRTGGGAPKPPPPSQPPPSVGVALDVSDELRMHVNKLKALEEHTV